MYVRTRVRTYIRTYVCMCMCVRVCVCVCVCVRVCVCVCESVAILLTLHIRLPVFSEILTIVVGETSRNLREEKERWFLAAATCGFYFPVNIQRW